MPKKGTSEGSVFFNKSRKRWTAQYYEIDITSGKKKRKTKDFKSEEEGKEFLKNMMYQKQNPLYIEHNGIPIVELMKSNLHLKYDTNLISDSQYVRVTETIKSIEKSSIAFEKIDEISSDDIQDFLNSKKSISNSSINKIFDQFKQAYNYAINQGYISKNPMVNVIKPKSDKETKKVRALTVKEQQQFTDWLIKQNVKNFPYKNIYLIQMYVGLRIGEVLALQTSDINLRLKKINVNKTLTKNLKGKVVMGKTTKTYSGLRNVPIPYSLYPYILEQIEIAKKNRDNPENLLFKPEEKQYTSLRDVNDVLKTVLKYTLGITDITTHSLRHTYGTRCIEAGMQPVVLQRLMGHKDISVTLNTYTDVLNEFKNEEIEKVNDYYLQKDLLSNPKTLNEFEK